MKVNRNEGRMNAEKKRWKVEFEKVDPIDVRANEDIFE
jgi:hypothetical protein